jgi:hypothetical protein
MLRAARAALEATRTSGLRVPLKPRVQRLKHVLC